MVAECYGFGVQIVPSKAVEPELSDDPHVQSLCKAFLACSDEEQLLLCFLRDVLSFAEIKNAANRWAIAQQLLQGKSQADTARLLGQSTRTVNNMARWVNGYAATGGIVEVYRRLNKTEDE